MSSLNIVFRVESELKTKLDRIAQDNGLNLSSLIRCLLIKQINHIEETGNLLDLTKKADDDTDSTRARGNGK